MSNDNPQNPQNQQKQKGGGQSSGVSVSAVIDGNIRDDDALKNSSSNMFGMGVLGIVAAILYPYARNRFKDSKLLQFLIGNTSGGSSNNPFGGMTARDVKGAVAGWAKNNPDSAPGLMKAIEWAGGNSDNKQASQPEQQASVINTTAVETPPAEEPTKPQQQQNNNKGQGKPNNK